MKITNKTFPSLYVLSDDYSNKTQETYFCLVFTLLILTVLVEVLSYTFGFNFNNKFNLFGRIFAILLFGIIILINKHYQEYENSWYKARSLAESVKTIVWKFMMSSGEFFGLDNDTAEKKLKSKLNKIRKDNENIISLFKVSPNIEVITSEMRDIRNHKLSDRIKIYNKERILEQEEWYIKKANYNSEKGNKFNKLSCVIYSIVVVLLILNIFLPNINLPIDLFLILAVSLTSWSKYKKYNELAIAYKLTIHDISFMKEEYNAFTSDEDFSTYVEDCENAFSREHTRWYARKK